MACALGADIHITKRVPWGAGMGGGSSDAASTLLALNRLWNLGWTRTQLATLGPQLGADVPFFVGGRNAFVQGVGEQLLPIDLPALDFVVVKPPAAIATAAVFSHPGLKRDTEADIVAGSPEEAGVASNNGGLPARWVQDLVPGFVAGVGRNDLQPAAEDRCADVAQAARWLETRFGNSRMTGSGSAVFARVAAGQAGCAAAEPPGPGDATAASPPAEALGALPPGWVGRVCHSLFAHPLVAWAD